MISPRRFSKWRDENARDDDFALFERGLSGNATWDELLKYQRAIVLAEAGSGKSKELEEQAKKLVVDGQFAFHATVQNVAKEGVAGALDASSKERLEAWKGSEAMGWFFIDSVDEAKLDDIRFVDALRKLSDGLGSGLARARIIISGRYSRWECASPPSLFGEWNCAANDVHLAWFTTGLARSALIGIPPAGG